MSEVAAIPVEICILAGGLSTRMGRDKARLRLGGRTLLGHVRQNAAALQLPLRILRRDRVRRCGPLGGIYTALVRSRAQAILFLSCDMPFVSAALLKRVLTRCRSNREGAGCFVTDETGRVGFPFLLGRGVLPVVQVQLRDRNFSLQALAETLKAMRLPWPARRAGERFNINTPADWERAQELFQKTKVSPN